MNERISYFPDIDKFYQLIPKYLIVIWYGNLLFCRHNQFSHVWKFICCSRWQASEKFYVTEVLQPWMSVTNSSEYIFSPGLCTAWEVFANTAPGCCQPCKMNERTCVPQAFTCPTFISQKVGKGLVPHEMSIQRDKNTGKEARGGECKCICHLQ